MTQPRNELKRGHNLISLINNSLARQPQWSVERATAIAALSSMGKTMATGHVKIKQEVLDGAIGNVPEEYKPKYSIGTKVRKVRACVPRVFSMKRDFFAAYGFFAFSTLKAVDGSPVK